MRQGWTRVGPEIGVKRGVPLYMVSGKTLLPLGPQDRTQSVVEFPTLLKSDTLKLKKNRHKRTKKHVLRGEGKYLNTAKPFSIYSLGFLPSIPVLCVVSKINAHGFARYAQCIWLDRYAETKVGLITEKWSDLRILWADGIFKWGGAYLQRRGGGVEKII